MPRFKFPVNVATTAIALVIGATSATAATHLVLASETHGAASADAPPPGPSPSGDEPHPTSRPHEHTAPPSTEPHPTTTTTRPPEHTEPSTYTGPPSTEPHPTTTTTRPPEHTAPPSTEPHPTTTTTRPPEHTEPSTYTGPPSTEPHPTTTTTAPATTVQTLSLGCRSGMPDGVPTASCAWSKATAAGFHHYRLTREVVGTPRQEIFTTTDHDVTGYVDHGLQVGANYSYIIEAYDADGRLIARSQPFHFTCCEGASTTA